MKILGIDPGLLRTGWGIISINGNAMRFVACGIIRPAVNQSTAFRLAEIDKNLSDVMERHKPDTAAIEETFVNRNPLSSLKLGLARGVAMVVPARFGLDVAEYPANLVKKSVVGTGHADKNQIQMMVDMLLPGQRKMTADEADALAVAICHAHHAASYARIAKGTIQ
jgi:crossover junction endodeoxyribonuclease RuvC